MMGQSMRQETVGVTENLLKSATEEFLEKGFMKASLRNISAKSGVSTNSIYTRFKDKEGLFSVIVKETADGLMDIYLESIQKATYSPDLNQANSEGEEGTDFVLDYIYQHFIEFKLIFCCSTGSQYEHFLDELGKIEESYYQELVDKYGKEGFTVDPFFIHVFCRAGWQTMYELVAHDCSYKEAQSFMNSTKLFNVAGWKAVMGIDE